MEDSHFAEPSRNHHANALVGLFPLESSGERFEHRALPFPLDCNFVKRAKVGWSANRQGNRMNMILVTTQPSAPPLRGFGTLTGRFPHVETRG